MKGLIAIEEAVQIPELAHEAKNHAPGEAAERLAKNLVDIHEQRLQAMDQFAVDMQVSVPSITPSNSVGPLAHFAGSPRFI